MNVWEFGMGTGLIEEMHRHRLVAVVRSKTSEEAQHIAHGVAEGGVKFIEITYSVPDAVELIQILGKHSGLCVGAGTVLSPAQAEKAIDGGARFIVSPTLELNLIPICRESRVACISGAATPTEILTAARAGADLVKVFPADLVGGTDFIRQMLGPFPQFRFMVSGGVSRDNVKEYVNLGVTGICLGSAYLGHLLRKEGYDSLVRNIRQFVGLVGEAQTRSS